MHRIRTEKHSYSTAHHIQFPLDKRLHLTSYLLCVYDEASLQLSVSVVNIVSKKVWIVIYCTYYIIHDMLDTFFGRVV